VVFTRVLAEAQDESDIVDLMTALEEAHTETIEWIRVRLAELAQGGPVALAPTPSQVAVGALTRFATLPTRQSAVIFNRAADVLQRGRVRAQEIIGNTVDKARETTEATEEVVSAGRDKAQQTVGNTVKKARETAEATEEVVSAGRDAAVKRTEEVAPNADVRQAARNTRENLGTVDAEDLPVKDYDSLSGQDAIAAVNDLDDAEKLRVVLRYEQAHKDRKGVSTAAQKRLTELADESVSA